MQLPDGVVWLASFPKSGNTWLRILLSNMLSRTNRPEDINSLSLAEGIASGRGVLEGQTLVETDLLRTEEIRRLRPGAHDGHAAERSGGSLVKVHDAYDRLPDGTPLLGYAARAAVYIVRDPRDVAVSLSFHLGTSLDGAIEYLNQPDSAFEETNRQVEQRLYGWSGHVRSWLDQTDLPVHLVRYEDVHADTAGAFRRVLDFIGAAYDADTVAKAVRHADFAELQRQERDRGFRERPKVLDQFFRRGVVGDWRRVLTPDQALAIETTHAATMARLRYEPSIRSGAT